MAIQKRTKSETVDETKNEKPAFEETGETTAEEVHAEASTTSTKDRIEEAAAKHATTVATRTQSTAVAVHRQIISPFEPMKNAFTVNFDTLLALQANQGNFMTKLDGDSLGESITLELLSFQDNYILATGEDQSDEEAAKLVKYSDDGITTKDGRDCKEYIQELLDADYPKAKMSKRVVLVGALVDPGKMKDLEGTLVQIDLPPTSKAAFDRYQIQTAYDVSKGKYDAESAKLLRMTCSTQKKDKLAWTVVDFKRFQAK